jgi:hypothetical protein
MYTEKCKKELKVKILFKKYKKHSTTTKPIL